MMLGVHDEDEVFRLAISAVPSLGPFRVASTSRPDPESQTPRSLAERWTRRNPRGGGRSRGGRAWHLGRGGYAPRSFGRVHGYVVVVADGEPNDHEQFLLKALMHQTAAAMSNAAMSHGAPEVTEHVQVISEERAAVNDRLPRTVAELERQERTHERLAEASAGVGASGLRGHEVLGVISLLDPTTYRRGYEIFALEQASLLLAMELAHQRCVAELELRLRRELGRRPALRRWRASAYDRAAAVGHDLHGQHYVVSLRWRGQFSEHTAAAAAERGLGRQGIRSRPLTRRNRMCVLILPGRPDPKPLYRTIAAEMGSQHRSLGVGGVCDSPAQIPQSYEESVRAVRIRESSRSPDGATSFADLGVYRILGTPETHHEVEAFVAQWLAPLLAYDARRHTQLTYMLAQYLDCGVTTTRRQQRW